MAVELTLTSEELDDNSIHETVEKLCDSLKHHEIEAAIKKVNIEDARGWVEVSSIILPLISGGGALVTLINVLKTYVGKSSKMNVKVEKNGKQFTIEWENLKPSEMEQTIKQLTKLIGD